MDNQLMMEFFKRQNEKIRQNYAHLLDLRNKGCFVPQTICHICGSDEWHHAEDYLDGHTLMERHEDCGHCGYHYSFSTGNHEETIARWVTYWNHTETDEESLARHAARQVAILIRHLELGQIRTSIKPFVEALAERPESCDTAKVLADWIDDHPDEFPSATAVSRITHDLRAYNATVGFPACQYCGGAGEVYEHTSTCSERHCALAGGPNDCPGQISPCVCQEPYEANP